MAALTKAVQVSKIVNNVTKLFTNLSLSPTVNANPSPIFIQRVPSFPCALFHTTSKQHSLSEFFDDPKHWGEKKVRVGRSWRKDELRIKSNEDLHKLWFVLLKERNMLLTMEHAHNEKVIYFPNPERIDKVKDSMVNLESVVRERNQAYYMLETGTTGERPGKLAFNPLGIRSYYKMRQYAVPKFMNSRWHKTHKFGYNGYAVRKFLRLYREKLFQQKRRLGRREYYKVVTAMRMFPNLDLEAIKEKFPSVDIEKAKNALSATGHYASK